MRWHLLMLSQPLPSLVYFLPVGLFSRVIRWSEIDVCECGASATTCSSGITYACRAAAPTRISNCDFYSRTVTNMFPSAPYDISTETFSLFPRIVRKSRGNHVAATQAEVVLCCIVIINHCILLGLLVSPANVRRPQLVPAPTPTTATSSTRPSSHQRGVR